MMGEMRRLYLDGEMERFYLDGDLGKEELKIGWGDLGGRRRSNRNGEMWEK